MGTHWKYLCAHVQTFSDVVSLPASLALPLVSSYHEPSHPSLNNTITSTALSNHRVFLVLFGGFTDVTTANWAACPFRCFSPPPVAGSCKLTSDGRRSTSSKHAQNGSMVRCTSHHSMQNKHPAFSSCFRHPVLSHSLAHRALLALLSGGPGHSPLEHDPTKGS